MTNKKIIANIKPVRGLKNTIKVKGRLVKETEKILTLAICSDNCEKCPREHFFTFFKGKFWKASELVIGKMYELTISLNKKYLNPINIRESYARYSSSIGFIRGRVKEINGDKIILTNDIEINNPNNIYDIEAIKSNKESLLFTIKVININTGKVYTNSEGVEYPQYVLGLSLVGKVSG